jgi:hypothetical protein
MSTPQERQDAVNTTSATLATAKATYDTLKDLKVNDADYAKAKTAEHAYKDALRESNDALAAQARYGEGYSANGSRRRRRRKTRRALGRTRRSYRRS